MGSGRGSCCKRIVASVLGAAIIATIVATCVVYIPRHKHHKTIDDGLAKVTNEDAFKNGGAQKHPGKTNIGKDDAKDEYHVYKGKWSDFPKEDDWVSFDHLWESNLKTIKTACKDHHWGENNSEDENDMIKEQINYVSRASLVDNRFILAVIMQESKGCLRVTSTDSVHGVHNPGLMQSHNGADYNPSDKENSIRQMIKDGAQGTSHGDGLVQTLNKFGNAYSAARCYNSGDVGASKDLGDAIGATPCYVSDVANRLMGWVTGDSPCQESDVGDVQQSSGTSGQAQSDSGGQTSSQTTGQTTGETTGQTQSDNSGTQNGQQSSTSWGGNADGTFTGGHWDTNGNYVKGGGGGGSSRKRWAALRV